MLDSSSTFTSLLNEQWKSSQNVIKHFKQCIFGMNRWPRQLQNSLIYANNKLILRLKQFNFAVATNRRLVMLAFNLLPQLPTMYYVLYCFKTDGILCILHNHLYHAIHQLSNVNQPFWDCIIQSFLHFLDIKILFKLFL